MTISGRLLEVFGSATPGAVPASGGGTTNFLRADGTWAAPAGGGGGGSLTVSAPNKILGRVSAGSGPAEEIDCTAFARTVFDDADAPTAATTLGLGTGSNVTHERLTIATATANQIGATFSGVSLTGANTQAILDLSATWNTTGHANAIKINIANSASGGSSKFLDCQVNGTTLFYAKTSGEVYAQSTVIAGGSTTLIGGSTFGVWTSAGRAISINSDCNWERDAANSMALRNATFAQSLGVYNQWATSTNYERFVADWKTIANVLRLKTEAGSAGGTCRGIEIGAGDAVGSNIAGSDTIIVGGRSTGSGASGSILFKVGQSGAAATTLNAMTTVLSLVPNGTTTATFGGPTSSFFASGTPVAGWNATSFYVNRLTLSYSSGDVGLSRSSANVMAVDNGSTGGAAMELTELAAAPSAPGANKLRYFALDNGSGKTQFCVLFPSGAVQVLATEP